MNQSLLSTKLMWKKIMIFCNSVANVPVHSWNSFITCCSSFFQDPTASRAGNPSFSLNNQNLSTANIQIKSFWSVCQFITNYFSSIYDTLPVHAKFFQGEIYQSNQADAGAPWYCAMAIKPSLINHYYWGVSLILTR